MKAFKSQKRREKGEKVKALKSQKREKEKREKRYEVECSPSHEIGLSLPLPISTAQNSQTHDFIKNFLLEELGSDGSVIKVN